jgi:hypothetical protein
MPSKKNTPTPAAPQDVIYPMVPDKKNALNIPISRGSLIRVVRNPEAKARGDFIEKRWEAISNDVGQLPKGWEVGVVAYPTYRSKKSLARLLDKKTKADLAKLRSQLRAEKNDAVIVRIKKKIEEKEAQLGIEKVEAGQVRALATYQCWVEFTHRPNGSETEIIARYKIVRRSGLLIRHQYARGGRRYAAPPKGATRPHPFRAISPQELADIPPKIRRLMEQVAAVVKVPLTPGSECR